MKRLVDGLNFLSRVLLGVAVFDLFRQAYQSKQEAQKAEKFAKNRQLLQAVKITRGILSQWSPSPSFFERHFRHWAMGTLLERLEKQLKGWQQKISKANRLAARARTLEEDGVNSLEIGKLLQALQLYQQCNRLIYHPHLIEAVARLEQKLQSCKRFQQLVNQGQELAEQMFFKPALSTLVEAQKLFSTPEIERQIATYQALGQEEEKYEAVLKQASQLATEGRFQEAITLFEPALAQFTRADGDKFLRKLRWVITAKQVFRRGLLAEAAGDFDVAQHQYQAALRILPELIECRIRLGIVAIKNNNSSQTLSSLEGISGVQAAYLRGLAYAKQKSWQQAEREWRSISHVDGVEAQRQILKTLVRRDRYLTMREIEQLVDSDSLELAKLTSQQFIEKFGTEPLVEENLFGHIQPRLEAKAWKSSDWSQIATMAEQNWLEKQDKTSLHNWAVASYYQAQTDSTKLAALITAWSTALANIHFNPSLKNLPWLGSTAVDWHEVSSNLRQLLEVSIDAVKERNIEEYLRLRDLYRREMVALRLKGNSASCGLRVKELFITPGCYHRCRKKLPEINFPAEPWGALYTDWGLAVAACLEGDSARAIQIKPALAPSSEAERFAYSMVSYHEGCYYLQNHSWHKAITPLKQAKTEINVRTNWREEIDKLCGQQRQKIKEFDEHLDFAQFWYELLRSQPARSYLAEYKAEQIREKIANEKISFSQALSELKEIKSIDENNPVVLELIKKVEISQEMEQIGDLMSRDRFEEAVSRAKYAKHDEIRYRIAKVLIEILLKGAESRQLPPAVMLELGCWAKELCPYEPAFQEIYRSLGISY